MIQKEIIHPVYNVKCKLNKSKTRLIKNASLDKPEATLYKIGQYCYIDPNTKKKKYYTPLIPGVTGKRRHDNNSILKIITPAIKN